MMILYYIQQKKYCKVGLRKEMLKNVNELLSSKCENKELNLISPEA